MCVAESSSRKTKEKRVGGGLPQALMLWQSGMNMLSEAVKQNWGGGSTSASLQLDFQISVEAKHTSAVFLFVFC